MSRAPTWVGDVSHETMIKLTDYAALLLKWNATINLVGKTTEADLWTRHIWDSYQLVALVPRGTSSIVDLGCGAGLPGIVLAIAYPEIAVTLVERDQRKCTFLREAVRALGLGKARVLAEDAKNLTETFDMVTSRALAALDVLFEFAAPIMGKGSICFFPKGENFATEVVQARKHWTFSGHVIHSKTNEKAGIISVTELKPA